MARLLASEATRLILFFHVVANIQDHFPVERVACDRIDKLDRSSCEARPLLLFRVLVQLFDQFVDLFTAAVNAEVVHSLRCFVTRAARWNFPRISENFL